MHGVGFEPTRVATIELESTALDHSAIHASSLLSRNRLLFQNEPALIAVWGGYI